MFNYWPISKYKKPFIPNFTTHQDFWINDISLAKNGEIATKQALIDMPGLKLLEEKYAGKKPFKNINITGCVIVTYETAAFVLLLQKLGANLRWCSDNRFASIDEACALIASKGIPIFAKKGMTEEEYEWCFEQSIRFKDNDGNLTGPDLIIDDGCDITRFLHKNHPEIYEKVIGTSEQTTCGISEHFKLYQKGQLKTSVINVNEAITKSKFDNIYGSRESLIEGLHSAINLQLGGKNVVIFGYGEVGKGCAKVLEGLGSHIHIVEIDPIMAMQAHMEGYRIMTKAQACEIGEIFITATGCIKTISEKEIAAMKDGAILLNMGHGNMEINIKYLNSRFNKVAINPNLVRYEISKSKYIYVIAEGYLANLVAGEGHPPRVMSLTFTNHVLALMELLSHATKYHRKQIYKLPRSLDEEAARLNFPEIADSVTKLTDEQAEYLGISVQGPYKRDDYRY